MIKVEQFSDLQAFELKLNDLFRSDILSTHVGVDKSGWWAVVVYDTPQPYPPSA